ncbi:CoA-binding domain protein [Dehalogenimonas lykanthroporepellens BL-DC-9]|jgi:predicted CoA-binding protein|nr:CoA-binding domain protein [Dehalogenimonas lykanthroporepellens BL-DC-9]
MRREQKILKEAHTVAVVGASPDISRHSNAVTAYLMAAGFRVIPVNPNVDTVLGQKTYPDLASIPEKVDIVNVFRASEYTPGVAEEAVAIGARVLWLQQGIVNDEAADIAMQGGLEVIMDRCIARAHAAMNGVAH